MLKNDMGYTETNVRLMGLNQRVAIGLAALQEANREEHLISKPIMDAFRRELRVVEGETPEETAILDAVFAEFDDDQYGPSSLEPKNQISENELPDIEIRFKRIEPGLYGIYNQGRKVGEIKRDTNFKKKWIVTDEWGSHGHLTLEQAKQAVIEEWE